MWEELEDPKNGSLDYRLSFHDAPWNTGWLYVYPHFERPQHEQIIAGYDKRILHPLKGIRLECAYHNGNMETVEAIEYDAGPGKHQIDRRSYEMRWRTTEFGSDDATFGRLSEPLGYECVELGETATKLIWNRHKFCLPGLPEETRGLVKRVLDPLSSGLQLDLSWDPSWTRGPAKGQYR